MAVAEPSRWEILRLLGEQPRSVTELAEATGLSVAATCRHLQRLRAVGIVDARRHGKELQCRPAAPDSPIGRWLGALLAEKAPPVSAESPRRVTVRPRGSSPAPRATPEAPGQPSHASSPPPGAEKPGRPARYHELEDYLL